MDYYLIRRPSSGMTVSYGYKTDVLASYGNKEDRIAQRDTPRIGFSYSFMVSDLKTALNLDREIQNAGNTGTVWLPDWSAAENIGSVRSGTNTYTPLSGITNFADGQDAALYVSDTLNTVVTVHLVSGSIVFDSSVEYDNALLIPLYACDMTGEPEISQPNSLCCNFSVTLEASRPEMSPVSDWSVKYQGHDVWAGFKVSEDGGIVVRKPEQEVQENDYDIGVRDRFTFFDRMYDGFGTTVICETDELPAFRNFIKRRYGKTYSFFMPSGTADFQKAGDSGDTVGSLLRIRNNKHDFSARPYIVIQTDETANYAHVIALQDDNGDPVRSDYSGEFVTLVLEESFEFKYRDIDSVQILYFVRLNDDEVAFNCIGNAADEKPVYSIDLSMIETDFYDASLIDYQNTWGSAKDLNTIYLFKAVNGEPVLENGTEYGFSLVKRSGWESAVTAGRREGSYAVSNNWSNSSGWLITLLRTERAALIGEDEDFVFQLEGRFTEEGSYTLIQTNLYTADICARIFRSDGYYWMQITGTHTVTVKMNRWLGDEFGWHEWAVQRHNGRLYFLCDGLLCGTSDDLKHEEWRTLSQDEEIPFAVSPKLIVQQFRLAKGINVYPCETDTVNDEYRLNHYSLNRLRPFDNATVCIFDFKNCRPAHTSFTLVEESYTYENRNCTWDFAAGDTERVRRSNEFIVNGDPGSSQSYNSSSQTGKRITSSYTSIWAIHPDIVLEENYHHDFWFEFTMVISDDQAWSEQIIFPLPGLMVTAKISSGEYTIEGFGLASGVYVNIGEAVTFAACLDSRNNRICTYVNGQRTGMTTITAFMQTNKDGMISLYPLAIRRPQDCDSREYYLHRLRIVEKCLTSDTSYAVESEWTLGEYYTVPFVIEYGTRNSSDTKILEIKNIESVHPFAPYFTALKQSQTALRCNKLWSDGGRKTEVVSPAERTLYTVTLTDPKTGIQGYGWYYVYPNYDGIYYKSILTKKQNVTENFITQTVPIIRGERYKFEEQKKEIYKPAVVPIEYFEVVSPFDEIEYNRIGNSLHVTQTSYSSGVDFLSGDGTLPRNGSQLPAVSRWGSERRIKQIEFVLNPPFIPYFYGSDASGTYRYSFYNNRIMQYRMVSPSHDDASDTYLNASNTNAFYGTGNQFVTVKSGCPYWTQWREKRNHYGYCCQGSSGSAVQYDPDQSADPYWIKLNDMMYMEPKKPIHVAVQFCFAALSYYVDAWSKYNRIFQMPEKIWIEGIEYVIPEQWRQQYKDKFGGDTEQITLNDVRGETAGIRSLFAGTDNHIFYNFMARILYGLGGLLGYDSNLWTNHIACMKAYENEHYRGDFDAGAVMAKLEDERVDWIYWGE